MAKKDLWKLYHEEYKFLVIACTFGGWYHPYLKRIVPSIFLQKCLKIYCCIVVFSYCYTMLSGIFHFFAIAETLNSAVLDILSVTASGHSHFRLAWFYYRRKDLISLFDQWDYDFGTNVKDKVVVIERMNNVRIFSKKIIRRIFIWTGLAFCSLNFYLWLEFFRPDRIIISIPYIIPYQNYTFGFEATITSWLLPCFVQPWITGTLELSTLLILTWEAGELTRLSQSLSNILKKLSDLEDEHFQAKRVTFELGQWVKQHKNITMFHIKVQRLIAAPMNIELALTFVAAVLIAYRITSESLQLTDKIAVFGFFLPYLVMFKTSCSCCDTISKKSLEILNLGFDERWWALPREYKNVIPIIQARIKIAPKVKAYEIFVINSSTFMHIMRMAYSVVNFLVAKR